jgi:hypothetical protein
VVAVWQVLQPAVQHDRGQTVLLGGDPGLEPTIAGVALKLTQDGIDVTVPDALIPPFGPEEAGSPHTARRFLITEGGPPVGYRSLGTAPSELLGVASVTISEAVAGVGAARPSST